MHVLSIDSNEVSKLKDYRPIPWGTLKFLGGVANMLMIWYVLISGLDFCRSLLMQQSFVDDWHGIVISAGICLHLVAIFGLAPFFLSGARASWIKSYFARNVRGFLLRMYIPVKEGVVDTSAHWYGEIVTDENIIDDPCGPALGGIQIEVRLGGWFASGLNGIRVYGLQAFKENWIVYEKFEYWQVRLLEINDSTRAVVVQVSSRYPDRGGKSDTLQLTAEQALQLLIYASEHYVCDDIGSTITQWHTLMVQARNNLATVSASERQAQDDLLAAREVTERLTGELAAARSTIKDDAEEVLRLGDELQSLKGELETEQRRRRGIIYELMQVEGEIAKADRLCSTLEGLEIWLLVLGLLAIIHNDNGNDKDNAWHDKLVVVRDRLAQARKTKRSSKRGRSAKASKASAQAGS